MKKVKIGIIGCGAIGGGVASFIDKELSSKANIVALADIDNITADTLKNKLKAKPKIMDIDALIEACDLVIEAASVNAAEYILDKTLEHRKDVVILSVGALLKKDSILEKAEKKGIKIYIPSGAICGVDGVGALSLGDIRKISLITSKPPEGLAGAAYLKKKNINLDKLKKEKIVFKGGVREAIRFFPKNINVAAILLLASPYKGVEVCIKANPFIKRNIHRIEIKAKEANINIEVENVPSQLNPKTSTLAILSTKYLLKKMFSSFKIGG
ncbi:MAG: aspartate dehydrogenase domain-containing protein [Candidatus Omnitrophota bacterium]|nr:DUF108 domain-containing protein [Candidatus Omnitrophota bacterium]